MEKLNINKFELGDKVIHASSSRVTLIVTEIDVVRNQITCRWMNEKKETQSEKFIPQELVKYDSVDRTIYIRKNSRNSIW